MQKLRRRLIVLKFHTRSLSYWHCHRISSKYPLLTCMQAYRCVCHSLIARRVLEQHCPTLSLRHCLVFEAGNTRVYITSPKVSLVAYTICGTIRWLAGLVIRRLDFATFGCGFSSQSWHCPDISEIDDRISRVNYLGIYHHKVELSPAPLRGC